MEKTREQIVEDIANITDKHHDMNAFYRINCGAEIYDYIIKLHNKRIQQLEEAMQRFIDKVDRGEARSVKTYAEFKSLLKI